ncbi:prophage minor tail Z family protein [Escherichia coli 2756500]|nr:prophage minor tail Z family protein [Escherichia coli 2756500]
MAIKGLEQAVENLSRISNGGAGAAAMAINRVAHPRYRSRVTGCP